MVFVSNKSKGFFLRLQGELESSTQEFCHGDLARIASGGLTVRVLAVAWVCFMGSL